MVFTALAHIAGALTEPFGRLDARFAVAALALQGANLAFRSLAWRNVLAAAYPERRVPVVGLGAAYAAGVALNGFLPARGGEAAKVGLARLQLPGTSLVAIAASGSVVLILDGLLGGALLSAGWASGALQSPPGAPTALAAVVHHPWLGAVGAAALALLAWLLAGRLSTYARRAWNEVRRGTTILGSPGRYIRNVASLQLGAWAARVGVAFCLLAAFGLPATLTTAGLVVVMGGLSTLVPAAPGGMGAQQLLVVYGLHGTVSAASALSFSIGMQTLVTAVNTAIGVAALMLVFRTVRPVAAVRAGLRAGRS